MGATRRLRGAVIGLGNVAVHGHLPGWRQRPDAVIVAATDLRPGRQAECRAALPGARWHDSVEALLAADDLDFVDVCTPPSSHAALIEAALARGLHVLCEKPLVSSLAELERLAGLARSARAVLHTVHNWHQAPLVRATDALIRESRIGAVREVVWRTLRTQPAAAAGGESWRVDPAIAGGGVLTDHGWHVSYVLARRVGAPPDAVRMDIEYDTVILRADGREERHRHPPALSDGSQHPDWFGPVTGEFIARVLGQDPSSRNLDEAAVCIAVECGARESSRRGGSMSPLAARVGSAG